MVLLAAASFATDDGRSTFLRRDLVFQNYIDDTDLSPDGTMFAVVLEERAGEEAHRSRVELWNFSAGKRAEKSFSATWRGLPQVRLHFSGDGKNLLFYDGDGTLYVLDRNLNEIRHLDIGLASDDLRKLNELAATANPGRIEPLPVRPVFIEEMAVAPSGSLVAVRLLVREFSQMVRVLDFSTGTLVRTWGQVGIHSGFGKRMAWDAAGQRLALAFDTEIQRENHSGDILIYETKSAAISQFLRSGFGGVASLAFAGENLVVAPAKTAGTGLSALHTISPDGHQQQSFSVPDTGLRDPFTVTADGKTLVALTSRLIKDPNDSSVHRPLDTRFVVWDLSEKLPKAITPDLWPVKVPRVAISADARRLLVARHYDSRRIVLLELQGK
jgi:hypothetical protein